VGRVQGKVAVVSLEDTSKSHRNNRAAIWPYGRDSDERRYRNHASNYMTGAELVIDGGISDGSSPRPRYG
jgi:hypothetical protein